MLPKSFQVDILEVLMISKNSVEADVIITTTKMVRNFT